MAIWIVEASAFRTGTEAFANAALCAGSEMRWITVEEEFRGHYGSWERDATVVFRGSFEAAESFQRRCPEAHPGRIGDPEALRCSAYYPLLGERLLNVDHEFVPLRDLFSRGSAFDSPIFLRPDSGAKAFTGQLVTDLERFLAREQPYLEAMNEDDLLVVAPARRVEAEWRTVVVGREVVAGSRYKADGRRDVAPDVPSEVLSFAQSTASAIPPPAPVYMLDVAREEGGRLSVVELNSFASSDLYACDPIAVVEAVERLF